MSDGNNFNARASALLAAAQRAKAEQEAEAAKLKQQALPPGRQGVLADDTLGRLIQYCAPFCRKWGGRYLKVFGTLGVIFTPLKFRQQYLKAGVPLEQFSRWLDVNEPMILPKIIGIAALVAGWVILMWLAISVERERVRRKRLLKAVETGFDAGFNSQS